MRRIFIFATKADLLSVTNLVEKTEDLRYTLAFDNLFPEYKGVAPQYRSAAEILTIGIATRDQTARCENYVVSRVKTSVTPTQSMIGGKPVTHFVPGRYPDCIEFNAGGLWGEDILISGLIQTWSDSLPAQQLMRKFSAALKKQFAKKINGYWVGHEAYAFLLQGGRLTINVSADASFDLKV